MIHDLHTRVDPAVVPWLSGGEMGALIRACDWAQTPLGPITSWSPSLRMMVGVLLANRFPLLLWWGPQYISIYNDAYRPVLGTKHPWALGQPVSTCWSEIWHVLQPLIDTPFHGGPATWMEDLALEINRHGFVEETHFTVAYSPVPDETVPGGIGGVLATVHEISDKVVGERRVAVLKDLGTHASQAKTAEDACAIVAATLAQHPKDIPFALLYLLEADGQRVRLAGAAGVPRGSPASPHMIALSSNPGPDDVWPLADAIRTETMQIVDDLVARVDPVPPGPWADPPQLAAVMPIRSNVAHQPAGVLVAGISARLRFDGLYSSFLELVTTQIATAIANARAYEEERRRAEALAELDRAKTAFFSNVSHEFRTPLTLMLGPLEQALASGHSALSPQQHEELEVVHRNGLRLLKLVNTLLDFSRLEAGRIQASYEPTDLAACTADLASVFRSAIERAGLHFLVDCSPLPDVVYIDREMWEKIVLNLLSNAFKFTFAGEIAVSLRWGGEHVALAVRDTGTGIPEPELPHIFERFHRVRNARARTHEGTGIGLALVQELVRLHGGQITVASAVGVGTTFTVKIPTGTAHLPIDRIGAARSLASTALGADPYVEEARRWLPAESERPSGVAAAALPHVAAPASPRVPGHILLADDNADMRDYVQRLLRGQHWEVEAVMDGAQALAVAGTRRPDLVLADVMMPGLDGFALLRALRADPRTATIPVILLSARAGEESRVEGLGAGADDYLIKPFSARELLARVEAHLKLARLRDELQTTLRESEARFRNMADHAPVMIWVSEPDATCTYLNTAWYDFTGQTPETSLGFGWFDAVHPDDREGARHTFLAANARRAAFRLEYRLRRHDGAYCWAINAAAPRFGPQGEFRGYIGSVIDITERKQAEEALRDLNATLEQRIAERTAALEQAMAERQRLEHAARRAEHFALLGRLAAGVSHELRNPLGAVFLHVDLLAEELAQPSPDSAEAIAEALAEIRTNMARVDDLMQDYLSLVRVHTIQRQEQDLGAAVQAWAAAFQAEAMARGMRLAAEGLTDLGVVAFHANTLRRALLNLVQNALDAMPTGGTVTLRGQGTATQVQLQVGDTGCGIPAEQLKRIFEPLHTTKPGGTGLGLYIVQEIVAAHGGQVTVESEVGQGTTFTLTLPRAAAQEPPQHGSMSPGA